MMLYPLTTQVAAQLGVRETTGAFVDQIDRRSPAYQAGLDAGDIIMSFNGQAVTDPNHLVQLTSDAADRQHGHGRHRPRRPADHAEASDPAARRLGGLTHSQSGRFADRQIRIPAIFTINLTISESANLRILPLFPTRTHAPSA